MRLLILCLCLAIGATFSSSAISDTRAVTFPAADGQVLVGTWNAPRSDGNLTLVLVHDTWEDAVSMAISVPTMLRPWGVRMRRKPAATVCWQESSPNGT